MTGTGAQRIYCCIPGCRRSAPREQYEDSEEIICRRHWRMIDTKKRARHRTVHERWRRAGRFLRRKGDVPLAKYERITALFVKQATRAWTECVNDATIKSDLGYDDIFRKRPRHAA